MIDRNERGGVIRWMDGLTPVYRNYVWSSNLRIQSQQLEEVQIF